jgi:hypothetical protein
MLGGGQIICFSCELCNLSWDNNRNRKTKLLSWQRKEVSSLLFNHLCSGEKWTLKIMKLFFLKCYNFLSSERFCKTFSFLERKQYFHLSYIIGDENVLALIRGLNVLSKTVLSKNIFPKTILSRIRCNPTGKSPHTHRNC